MVLGALSGGVLAASGAPATHGGLPDYQPEHAVTETIRTWGSVEMGGLLRTWQEGFRKHHPEVRFADTLKGTETAQAALYTDVADLALMDRPILMIERHVMLRRRHHLPFEVKVAAGSHEAAERAPALAVFVHRDNPLRQLSLRQLDGIFGGERTGAWDDEFRWCPERGRGADGNVRTWDQVGLRGAWAGRPIQAYGYPVTSYSPRPGPMLFFRQTVLDGGDMWNPSLREFEKGEEITAALSADRYGIAYAPLACATPSVKPIAIGTGDGGGYFEPNKENVSNRKYPLARFVYIFIDWSPGKPHRPQVVEFLRYILSRQGQMDVARDGGYLPLTPEEAGAELRKLD